MPSTAASAPYTWDDFVALEEDDLRELIDGELVEVEVPTHVHERMVALFCFFLEAWARKNGGGRTFASGAKVRVSDSRGVMPDVQFYRAGNEPSGSGGRGRPDIAIEILSSSSVRYDRVVKLAYYASIGVPEYWLVDTASRTVERLVLDGERYAIAGALGGDEVLTTSSFEGLAIPLADLWRAADEARALDVEGR
jgi:Uma2 family endonuclease